MIDFKEPFAAALRAGEVVAEQIDDYVEYWHTHDTGNSLMDFLGMTKDEYVRWLRNPTVKLYEILGAKKPKIEIPKCKICGCKMGVETAVGIIMKSCYNGTDICDDCMLDHCLSTNCLGCKIGKYPECEHLSRKKFYLEEERIERENAKKEEGEDNDSE
jgi:hypothetical protein